MTLHVVKKNLFASTKLIVLFFAAFAITPLCAQTSNPKTPLMGWASWNQYGVNINDSIIKAQADAMVSSGLANVGFNYINIDDGFFNGRNIDGSLRINTVKFPNGMKTLANYIHSKGLKAGFYSEAGANTCGSIWSSQPGGVGAGLYNHDKQDIDSIFKSWGYDFLKVDFCGGQEQKLDEKTRYTEIKTAIENTGRKDINYNVCRWQFPGIWVTNVADSWRMSGDINLSPGSTPKWSEIIRIIDQNTFLAPFVSPGHYNDMDMLEVGRGLTAEEDKSHFSMWCILSSPLVLGNNMATMTQKTKDILTNTEVIAINQDTTGLQARRIWDNGAGLQVWAKNLNGKRIKERAVVLFNRSTAAASISVKWKDLNLASSATVRDLWSHTDLGTLDSMYTATVPSHGVVVLKVAGKQTKLQEVFEAEYAWINNFNLTQNSAVVADQGRALSDATCSGLAKAGWLGNRADNYIEFRDIYANVAGRYKLTISYISGENRNATLSVNGVDTLITNLNSGGWSTIGNKTISVKLNTGYNTIRFSNATGWMPDFDKIQLDLHNVPYAAGTIKGSAAVCKGTPNVSYSVPALTGATSYIWTLPAGVTGASTNNTISVNFDNTAVSDSIKVKGHNNYGDGMESAYAVIVNEIPETPSITLNSGILQSSAANGNQWYTNNTILSNAVSSALAPVSVGDYYVIVTLNNCSSQPSNIISYNPTGINTTGFMKETIIYPNPTTGVVKVSIKDRIYSDYTVEIYNTAGSLLLTLTKNKSETEFDLDLRKFPSESFLIKISTSRGSFQRMIAKKG
jgi:hypothetical protein